MQQAVNPSSANRQTDVLGRSVHLGAAGIRGEGGEREALGAAMARAITTRETSVHQI